LIFGAQKRFIGRPGHQPEHRQTEEKQRREYGYWRKDDTGQEPSDAHTAIRGRKPGGQELPQAAFRRHV